MSQQGRQQLLERALVAFDRAHSRRRLLRRSGGVAAMMALVAAVAFVAWPRESGAKPSELALSPVHAAPSLAPHSYPAFVQILNDEHELLQALDECGSCQGVGREGARVFIVECSHVES
jgi:hypothetical protein